MCVLAQAQSLCGEDLYAEDGEDEADERWMHAGPASIQLAGVTDMGRQLEVRTGSIWVEARDREWRLAADGWRLAVPDDDGDSGDGGGGSNGSDEDSE